ncbi:MAG: phosphoenolpyruvate synthase [Bacteroidetes bacterium]|nr:phosphoenolpyruvate synthase [Bacteroidota bacterium]
MKHIIDGSNIHPEQAIGGKAKNLALLTDAGFNVPKWAVVDAERVDQMPFLDREDFYHDLDDFFGEKHEKFYAVRSSGIDEDGSQFSFAGQFETFLFVPYDQIYEKIIEIRDSVSSERLQTYRTKNQLEHNQTMAVIIQEMLNPSAAGVAFGMDPVSGNRNVKIVSSVYGLGEGLVSGKLDADTFRIEDDEITPHILRKTEMISACENGGTEVREVERNLQEKPSLRDDQILELVEILSQLEYLTSAPQDIEFAVQENQIYLLQTRPVTATGSRDGEYTLWDNSNIVESYPGITTPLTYSFILKMYDRVYRQLVGIMGVRKKDIEKHKDVFAHTLGLVRGRVYYNLLNWYKMLAMVPGYSINAGFMETMMGVKEKFDLKEDYKTGKAQAWFQVIIMLFNMIRQQIKLPVERKKFLKNLEEILAEYSAKDFENIPADAIIREYSAFEQSLLLEWKAPLVNDFFAMIWFGILQKTTFRLEADSPNLHNDLLCGSQDIISVQPIHETIRISGIIRSEKELSELFRTKNAEEIFREIQDDLKFSTLKKEIEGYIRNFGERCIGELKLESISYAQQPERYIEVLKSYVVNDVSVRIEDIDTQLRKSAEEKMEKALKNKFLKRRWFQFVLRKTREHVSSRENLRYERTRGFGMVRRMFSALGVQLEKDGILENNRDVFYLKLEEILLLKSFSTEEIRANINNRKKEFEEYEKQPIPSERFYTYGEDFSDVYIYSHEKVETIDGDLKGIGCCPGKVKGKVRVVHDPHEVKSLNGDILVTTSTDPGWVTLFPSSSAILVERGSLLSHSAIVSREMGIPCIVGVSGLLRTLRTGDEVLMDGSSGIIKRLS